jgi:hypothetical protein
VSVPAAVLKKYRSMNDKAVRFFRFIFFLSKSESGVKFKKMKKLFAIVAALAMVGVVGAKAVSAVVTTEVGVVEGVVSGVDNNAVNGANVTVVCHNPGGDVTKTTTTDATGFYLVQYSNYQCVPDYLVTVTAEKDGNSGTREGNMVSAGSVGNVHLDIAIVNVPIVPEFGLITGAFALVTSAGSMFMLRRKVA